MGIKDLIKYSLLKQQMDESAGIDEEYHHKNNRVSFTSFPSILISLVFVFVIFFTITIAGVLLERFKVFCSARFGRIF